MERNAPDIRTILYGIVLLVFTLVYLVFFCAVFILTVAFDRERVILHHASKWWAVTIFRMNPWWSLKLEGKENVDPRQPCVIVTNHNSMLDIPIMYVLPLTFKWVSKREVYKWPVFGMVLWMHGDIAIDRGNAAKSLKGMIAKSGPHLERGTSVIVFPEGTRSRDGRVGKFKEGAFAVAKAHGVPVLPCVIEGTGTVIKGKRLAMPHKFTVTALKPIDRLTVEANDPRTLAEMTREMMTEKLNKQ